MSLVRSEQPVPGVTLLTLNRPEKLNAMTAELIADLYQRLDEINLDPDCRVVVITGAGRAFCAGLDLTGYGEPPNLRGFGGPAAGLTVQQHIAELVPRLRSLRQPVIAAVNGAAAGGGFALTLASDVRIAAESARFNVAFVRVGLSGCDIGVSWMLPRLIGASKAFELLLTGRLIGAADADRIGLVSRVVPDDQLLDAALELAAEIAANSPIGVWMTKEVMWSQLEISSQRAGIDLENRTQIMTGSSADTREAMASFLEKRTPEWSKR